MIEDGHSGALESFKWKINGAELNDYIQSPVQKVGESHSAVSVLKITNTGWDSKAVYTCEVVYGGNTYVKKASKGEVPSRLLTSDALKEISFSQHADVVTHFSLCHVQL